jgi:hypothetical protein
LSEAGVGFFDSPVFGGTISSTVMIFGNRNGEDNFSRSQPPSSYPVQVFPRSSGSTTPRNTWTGLGFAGRMGTRKEDNAELLPLVIVR